ncbi:MAG: efflux transporter outer membrane subunit [Syntrophobacteraceae bacterium]
MRLTRSGLFLGTLVALVSGCMLGPDYKRPVYPVPAAYRGVSSESGSESTLSFGDKKWFDLFRDEKLQELIVAALQENYNVQIAAQRVIEARSQVTIARADLFPSIDGSFGGQVERISQQGFASRLTGGDLEQQAHEVSLNLSWELDLWGRIRRSTEAARAQLLASEENRKFVIQTLVTDLTTAYFQLLELDLEHTIAEKTLASREDSLRLVKTRQERGADTMLAVRQAESLLLSSSTTKVDIERLIEQKENQISSLLGRNPGPIPRGSLLEEQDLQIDIPAGLPSDLIERRPDIRATEEALVAANANIGVARALFFPRISLTGSLGRQSEFLGELLSSGTGIWSAAYALAQPIFNAGRIQANVKATEARQQQALLQYLQSIQQAFREVADALVAYRKFTEFCVQQRLLTTALADQTRLAKFRYEGGATSYLDVLDAERQYFDAQIQYARAELNQILSVVALYKALGGGWQNAEMMRSRGDIP